MTGCDRWCHACATATLATDHARYHQLAVQIAEAITVIDLALIVHDPAAQQAEPGFLYGWDVSYCDAHLAAHAVVWALPRAAAPLN